MEVLMVDARKKEGHEAQRRSELAKQMRTAPSKEERSKAAKELSHLRSSGSRKGASK